MRTLIVLSVIAVLFLAGQWYLHSRRRKARALFKRLSRQLGIGGQANRFELVLGSHRVVVDAQVTREDRPEELRLTVEIALPGEFRLTHTAASSHYKDCRHSKPAPKDAPLAGWHARSEDPVLLQTLSADRRFRESLEGLTASGFVRVELKKGRLRAVWPDFPWEPDKHDWDPKELQTLPNRVTRAAGKISELAIATEAGLQLLGQAAQGARVQLVLNTFLVFPLLFMAAGALATGLYVYNAYPTLRDEQLLVAMILASAALSIPYTAIAYLMMRKSILRGARTAVVGLIALLGFFAGSSAPILWCNGTGPQRQGQRFTAEVVSLRRHSAFDTGMGRLVRKLTGEDSPVEKWFTTYRAIIRSWRDPAEIYAVTLSAEQFFALHPQGVRLSFTVFPGALGLEWYFDVVVEVSPPGSSVRSGPRKAR